MNRVAQEAQIAALAYGAIAVFGLLTLGFGAILLVVFR